MGIRQVSDTNSKDCATCGHSWCWHAFFDEVQERYVDTACDHWSGCDCKHYVKQQPPCKHDGLNMEGICHTCGADCRGIG